MSEKKNINWPKLIKIVAEFIVAFVTALFASSFCVPYVSQLFFWLRFSKGGKGILEKQKQMQG